MALCIQEEGLQSYKGGSINYAKHKIKKKNNNSKQAFKKLRRHDDQGPSANKAWVASTSKGRLQIF
jgi:hypothetical protein